MQRLGLAVRRSIAAMAGADYAKPQALCPLTSDAIFSTVRHRFRAKSRWSHLG